MIDNVLNQCIEHKTLDNVTAVIIGFQALEALCETFIQIEPTELLFDWDKISKEADEETKLVF